ncbi:Globin CTT-VIIB-8 precursor, putative [Pediculus humanus corporis]|uniref:Globin CTT-VIIB-8, putative n=1 Tax=Pediculus humanus subsp. corporis TaxID=121224 RepID=E0VN28_PEDHC|nr:Globin CTT-VIIB-8 precursor, putative [Pediculus humanus corporis]EEB14794.1 Globin CTT-VIIB-8 precursor, putative [Pediculus humanus corporis]
MGLGSSKSEPLTADELERVQNSWKVVMENAEENGMFIFKTFLLKHNYFPYFKAFANTPLEELEENQAFRNHANNIIQALDNVILNLEDELTIQRELTALGKMHGKKKISEQQFQELKICILEILDNEFKLPEDDLQAWSKTLNNAFVFVFEGLAAEV